MIWVRKFSVFILALILFVAVLITTYATSLIIASNSPTAVKGWIAKSGVYDHVLVAILNKDESGDSSSAISISDSQVQTAAQEAFTPEVVQSGVESFINGNYDWLSGKSDRPDFRIDLTKPKDNFGNIVQNKVKSYLSGLPVCNPQQAAALQGQMNVKLFSLPCRPENLNADSEAARAKEQIANADFLSNPIITASTFTNNDPSSKVYYVKLSKAPSLYREARFIPLVLLALVVALSFIVLVASTTRNKGKKNIAFVFFLASFVLIIGKVAVELIRVSQKVQWFNVDFSKDLNKPLNDLVNIALGSMGNINLIIALVLIITGILLVRSARKSVTVNSKAKPKKVRKPQPVTETNPIFFEEEEPPKLLRTPSPVPRLAPKPQPKKAKKPRLIQ